MRVVSQILVLFIGACAVPFMSETDMEIASEEQFEQMKQTMPLSTDAGLNSYIHCVARAIIAELEPPYDSKDWEVVIFEDESINAFAMAGGKIGVFTGILTVAENQDQLGAVLGHEVAHVTQQHALERTNRAMTTQAGVVGASAVLGGGQGTYELLSMGAQLGLTLPYGRGQESEADVVGLDYMADAGFDPRASVQLWKNMADANKGAPPEFMSTHPSSDTRISELIEQFPAALARYNAAKAEGKQPNCRR